MRIQNDRGPGLCPRLCDCGRQSRFRLILNRLIDCQNDRLARTSGDFGTFVGSAARIFFDEESAWFASDLFVVNLLDSR